MHLCVDFRGFFHLEKFLQNRAINLRTISSTDELVNSISKKDTCCSMSKRVTNAQRAGNARNTTIMYKYNTLYTFSFATHSLTLNSITTVTKCYDKSNNSMTIFSKYTALHKSGCSRSENYSHPSMGSVQQAKFKGIITKTGNAGRLLRAKYCQCLWKSSP